MGSELDCLVWCGIAFQICCPRNLMQCSVFTSLCFGVRWLVSVPILDFGPSIDDDEEEDDEENITKYVNLVVM